MSQTQLSKKIGIGQSTMAHYLKGDICPSLETIANICNGLELTHEEVCKILCIKNLI